MRYELQGVVWTLRCCSRLKWKNDVDSDLEPHFWTGFIRAVCVFCHYLFVYLVSISQRTDFVKYIFCILDALLVRDSHN